MTINESRAGDTTVADEDFEPSEDGAWFDCWQCGGEGWEDRYEQDPLWYGHELYRCDNCHGKGGWLVPWEDVRAEDVGEAR